MKRLLSLMTVAMLLVGLGYGITQALQADSVYGFASVTVAAEEAPGSVSNIEFAALGLDGTPIQWGEEGIMLWDATVTNTESQTYGLQLKNQNEKPADHLSNVNNYKVSVSDLDNVTAAENIQVTITQKASPITGGSAVVVYDGTLANLVNGSSQNIAVGFINDGTEEVDIKFQAINSVTDSQYVSYRMTLTEVF